MDTAQLTEAVNQLNAATKELTDHAHGLARLVDGLPCDSYELLQLLDELANADEDCSQHFVRFDNERGVKHSESSQECQDDWTRCHNRRMKAESKITRFARALRFGLKGAA